MFRNQYDSDVTVWSPQGRIHQVEYAMEAVNLGSATVGLKSKTHAVLIALKRASSELSAYQKKIIGIDGHVGMAISGLTADARILSSYMRNECLNYKYSFDDEMPLNRLISVLGNKMQLCTQRYDRRPFGVGLLVAGYDDKGTHIYQTCPSANFYDCKAMSIGSRSQSARTYLEKHLQEVSSASLEELIKHGLRALRDTLPPEVDLNTKKCLDWISLIEGEERRGGSGGAATEAQPADPLRDDAGDDGPQDPTPAVAMDTTEEFKNSWHVTPGMRQAKTHIEGPSLKLTKCLLGMNRRDIRMVTGLLTGHCHLSRHLQLIGIAEDPECRWCLEDEETSSHVLTKCPAIARVRERHFGSSVLNPEDVKRIQPRKLCTFAKEVGIPS
ncbi:hypothetical protein NQ317_017534 [Molorchus minor]|uniref:Proteasome subunit alpha type-1 n=1 Tax=Molorchus minor TaxID=1323400 RepID=A0ABQ9JU71_9CUCU|nr:hypothetical protein NQ317_017534 [Molorchus minor]